MIPYVTVPPLVVGRWTLEPFTMLVITAVLCGHLHVILRSRRFGIPRAVAAEANLAAFVFGFVGSHLLKIVYTPGLLIRGWSGLFDLFSGMSSFGGLGGALVGMALYFRVRKIDQATRTRLVDVTAYAFPFSWVFGRAGCALGHDHPGILSSSPLAVAFPGGPRYDLGLLELMFVLLCLIPLFLWLDRTPQPSGFYTGVLLVIYGGFRVLLDQLHVDPPRYFGVSMDQWTGAAAIAGGWWFLRRSRAATTGPPR